MITKPAVTRWASIVALVLCVLTASLATEAVLPTGCVLGILAVICLARIVVKRWMSRGVMPQSEAPRGHVIVITPAPVASITHGGLENNEPAIIEMETEDDTTRIRRWLESTPSELLVIRGILRDYERLAKAVEEAGQENERLRGTVTRLIGLLTNLERDRERLEQEASQLKVAAERCREDIAGSLTEVNGRIDGVKRTLEQLLSSDSWRSPYGTQSPIRASSALAP